jgi:phosphocarrier protein
MSASNSVTIEHNLGLHLRAAGALVQLASRYQSKLYIKYGTLTANGKSIMSVLSLAAPCGATLEISAEGNDADEALQSVIGLIRQNFGIE